MEKLAITRTDLFGVRVIMTNYACSCGRVVISGGDETYSSTRVPVVRHV
jgi:hypothetical protein